MKSRVGVPLLSALLAVAVALGSCTDDPHGFDDGYSGGGHDGGDPGPLGPSLPGMYIENLISPLRITEAMGEILLTDSRRNLVVQLDPQNLSFGRAIHIDGKPLGIAYWEPFIYVGNAKRQTVEVYLGQGGRRLSDFGRGKVGHPSDIAVDMENSRLLVVDGRDKDVKIFSPSGEARGTIGASGAGHLENPIGIAVDSVRQEVLVTDYGNLTAEGAASIKIFDFQGNYLAEISGRGICGGGVCTEGFSRPQGVTIGDDGRIYVADALLGKVLVYDRETLGKAGEIGDRTSLRFTTDVAVGTGGDLFIVSNGRHEVRALRRGTAK